MGKEMKAKVGSIDPKAKKCTIETEDGQRFTMDIVERSGEYSIKSVPIYEGATVTVSVDKSGHVSVLDNPSQA